MMSVTRSRKPQTAVKVNAMTRSLDGKTLFISDAKSTGNFFLRVCSCIGGVSDLSQYSYGNSDVFNIHRENAGKHLAFSQGIHYCLGAPLARLEARIAFELLTARISDLRLAPTQDKSVLTQRVQEGSLVRTRYRWTYRNG
jgi:hypothetical protein